MVAETGILTSLLNTFSSKFTGGYSNIFNDAWHLLGILAVLELTIAAVWWALTDDNALVALLKKCIQVGFFVFVVTQYDWLIDKLVNGFIDTGLKAGGTGSLGLMKDPSSILDYGFVATAPIFQHIESYGPVDTMANLPDIMMTGLAGILVLMAFFILGIQIFITYLEFYLVSVLALILVPFGVLKYTSFIAEKAFGAMISFGIRLMVLAFIVSVAEPTLASLSLPPDPEFGQIMTMFAATLTIAILAWHAPAVAGGLISGSPSLAVGSAAVVGAAAGAGIAGAGLAGKAATQEAVSGAVGATRAGAATAGAVSAAARMGAAEKGGGALSKTYGAVKGVASMAGQAAMEKVSNATTTITRAYSSGAERVSSVTATAPSGAMSSAASDTGGARHESSPSAKASGGVPEWANRLQSFRNSVPPDTGPSAGMSVPIRKDQD